jgi:N-acetylmuramoyl-L-alanine amidase CwlA
MITGLIAYTAINHDKISEKGILSDIKNGLLGNNRDGTQAIGATLSNGVVIQSDLLTPNVYSRPQTPLKDINSIVVHYTANPGTTAANNRDYFEGLATKHTTYASSHYIIGTLGEVVQCVPLNEISFASNDRNNDTVSIECCHEDETGKFSDTTYASLVSLTAALCIEFNLREEDIIRHYDVTEKLCPLYYVEHEEEWFQFRKEVMAKVIEINENQKELQ